MSSIVGEQVIVRGKREIPPCEEHPPQTRKTKDQRWSCRHSVDVMCVELFTWSIELEKTAHSVAKKNNKLARHGLRFGHPKQVPGPMKQNFLEISPCEQPLSVPMGGRNLNSRNRYSDGSFFGGHLMQPVREAVAPHRATRTRTCSFDAFSLGISKPTRTQKRSDQESDESILRSCGGGHLVRPVHGLQ